MWTNVNGVDFIRFSINLQQNRLVCDESGFFILTIIILTNKPIIFNEVITLYCPYFRFYQVLSLYTTKDKAFSFRRCKPSLKTYRLVTSFISVYFLDDINC